MDYFFAWWNLENLFDLETSASRPDWLQKRLKKELEGWNADVLNTKLAQLSRIIKQLNNGTGPDLLGVCEIESKSVLEKLLARLDLPGRKYDIVHSDTRDQRGIDVAFIYDTKRFRKPRRNPDRTPALFRQVQIRAPHDQAGFFRPSERHHDHGFPT